MRRGRPGRRRRMRILVARRAGALNSVAHALRRAETETGDAGAEFRDAASPGTGPTRRRHTFWPAGIGVEQACIAMPAPSSMASARSALARAAKLATCRTTRSPFAACGGVGTGGGGGAFDAAVSTRTGGCDRFGRCALVRLARLAGRHAHLPRLHPCVEFVGASSPCRPGACRSARRPGGLGSGSGVSRWSACVRRLRRSRSATRRPCGPSRSASTGGGTGSWAPRACRGRGRLAVSARTSTRAVPARMHAELHRRGVTQVDHAAGVERAAVVDAHDHRLAVVEVGDAREARQRQRLVRGGEGVHVVHLEVRGAAAVEFLAVVRGRAASRRNRSASSSTWYCLPSTV